MIVSWIVGTLLLACIFLAAAVFGLALSHTKMKEPQTKTTEEESTYKKPSDAQAHVKELNGTGRIDAQEWVEQQPKYTRMNEFKTLQSAQDYNLDENATAACLYVFWSLDGRFGEHVTYMLEGLKAAGYDVYVIANCKVHQPVEPRVQKAVTCIFERQNVGYDFGAWSELLFERSSVWNPGQYDWVLFCNDTFAGPVQGPAHLRDMTLQMRSTGAKFWGLTDNTHYGADWHIQSYYFEAHQSVLTHPAFRSCFPRSVRDKNDLVAKGEVKMTKRLIDAGIPVGVAYPSLANYREENASVWYWDDLLRRGYPLLKHTVEVVDPQKVYYNWRDILKRTNPTFPIETAAEMFMNQERMQYLKAQATDMAQASFGRTFQRII